VIQINGKKRSKIMLEKDTSEALVLEKVKKDEKVIKNLDNKLIFKHIYVKNRLINLILK
jgi:leucyl-tRNA synthetase